MPLTAALVFSTLVVQLAYNNGVLFDAARALFCATYIVQSVPLLFFTYGKGSEYADAYGPYESIGGHRIPLDVRPDSMDVICRKVVFEGDLFLLGLVTPRLATDYRELGRTEDEVRALVPTRPLIVGMGERDFWYRVGMLLGLIELAFPGTICERPPRNPPSEKRPPSKKRSPNRQIGARRGFAKSTPLSHSGVLAALRRWGLPHPTVGEGLRGCLSAQEHLASMRASASPPPVSCMLPRLVANREGNPPVAIPDSLKLRGVNTPGYYRPGHTLTEEGRAFRDKVDEDTIKRLDSLGCTVLARHSGWRTLLKGAVGTVELDALGVNYEGLIKTVEDAYGVPLQRESLLLPSLGDGMIRCTDAVLINKLQGTDVTVFTTIDLLCVNPKTCFERSLGSMYTQMLNKQKSLIRETPPKILDRLDKQALLERSLRDTHPERYPDAAINAEVIECLKYPLSNGLGQTLHVVAVDTVCDPETHSRLIDYLEHRTEKEEVNTNQSVLKFVGLARVPEGVSLSRLNDVMAEGHDGLFTPLD